MKYLPRAPTSSAILVLKFFLVFIFISFFPQSFLFRFHFFLHQSFKFLFRSYVITFVFILFSFFPTMFLSAKKFRSSPLQLLVLVIDLLVTVDKHTFNIIQKEDSKFKQVKRTGIREYNIRSKISCRLVKYNLKAKFKH